MTTMPRNMAAMPLSWHDHGKIIPLQQCFPTREWFKLTLFFQKKLLHLLFILYAHIFIHFGSFSNAEPPSVDNSKKESSTEQICKLADIE